MKHKILIWIFALIVLSSFAYAEMSDDILGCYDFNGDTTNAYDFYDEYNLTVIGNATLNTTECLEGQCYYQPFGEATGLYSYLKFDNNISLGENFTLSIWGYAGDGTKTYNTLFVAGNTEFEGHDDFFFYFTDVGNFMGFNHEDAGEWTIVHDLVTYQNAWHMFTYTSNGTDAIIYIDNTIITNKTDTYQPTWLSMIGALGDFPANSYDWQGNYDQLAIWNRTLNATEIDTWYNGGSSSTCPPLPNLYDNFSITVKNTFYGETISNFTAIINGTTFYSNTTTSRLDTEIPNNSTLLHNITISTYNHDARSYINYNVTTDLDAIINLSYYRLTVTAINSTGDSITNFSVNAISILDSFNLSTITGTMTFNLTKDETYTVSIDAGNGTSTDSIDILMNDWLETIEFQLYTTNSVNITFLYYNNNSLANGLDIDVDFIGDIVSYNYTTSTGKLYVDLMTPQDYTVRYTAIGFGTNQYYFTLTNRSHHSLTFYLVDDTLKNVTVTIYDALTITTVEGAIIYLQRFNISTNTFNTIAMYESNVGGNAYFNIDNLEYHKFLVDYPLGTRRLETEKFYVESSTINLYISLTEEMADKFFKEESITSSLTFDDTINKFIGTWTDSAGVATSFCLYIKQYGYYGSTTLNSSCSTSSTGSFELGYAFENGTTYYAFLTGTIDSEETNLNTWWKEFVDTKLDSGALGLFLTVILVITFTLMGAYSFMALLFSNIGLILAKFLNIIGLDWGYIITIVIASLILAIIIKMKK